MGEVYLRTKEVTEFNSLTSTKGRRNKARIVNGYGFLFCIRPELYESPHWWELCHSKWGCLYPIQPTNIPLPGAVACPRSPIKEIPCLSNYFVSCLGTWEAIFPRIPALGCIPASGIMLSYGVNTLTFPFVATVHRRLASAACPDRLRVARALRSQRIPVTNQLIMDILAEEKRLRSERLNRTWSYEI